MDINSVDLPSDPNGRVIQVGRPVPASTITVAAGSSHAESAAVGAAGIYEVVATVEAYIEIGSSPVATTTTQYMAAGIPKFMRLLATDKVSALQKVSAGVVHITRWS